MNDFTDFLFGEGGIRELTASGDYASALALIDREGRSYPEFTRLLNFEMIVLGALLGNDTRTINALQGALDRGEVFPRAAFAPYLTSFGDHPAIPDSIQSLPEFQRLLDAHQEGWQKALDAAQPVHLSAVPDGIDKPPLVIGFHGNTSSVDWEIQHFEPLADLGYLAVMPQSAQPWAKQAYVWGDWANTEKQVAREWKLIKKRYTFDKANVITAGISKGGEVAVWSALSGTIPAKGVIGLGIGGPLVDHPDRLAPLVAKAKKRGVAFYFALGSEDHFADLSTKATADYLTGQGFCVHLEILKGVGHEYPPDTLNFWKSALAFING